MAAIPRERTPDSSLALLREGFEFVTTPCRRHGTDAFATRLMLRPVVCMQGAEAALFFTETAMTPRGAIPRPLLALVQDVGSVATLDGAMHRCRKRMFLDMMSGAELARLERISDAGFVVFAALALHRYSEAREAASGDAEHETAFVHEVRRFYPFFPAIGGRTLAEAQWRGETLPAGQWVLLDIYGTNRDPRMWEEADRFLPARFLGSAGDPYTFVPQGAGEPAAGHRCPGEGATIALVRSAVRALTRAIAYTVPEQDLRIPRTHIPPRPASGFLITPQGAGAP